MAIRTFTWPASTTTITGVAQETTQQAVLAELTDFHADNSSENSGLQSSLTSIDSKNPALVSGRVPVDGSGVTQPVSGTVAVSNFPATQPVSGTVTANQGTGGVSAWKVDGSAVTQPISASALPLPTGASTSALQTSGNSSLSSIDGKVPANLTVTSTRLLVDGSGVTQPVSAASLPLPTGAATETTLSTLNGKVPSNLTVTATRLLVDGSGVTQPVSAASLPLPTGAATAAKQPALGTAGSASADVITVQGIASMTALKVDGSAVTQPVSGTVNAAQSGTWTVQPGNTANTTAWLVQSDKSSTATLANVSGSASSVTLQASNSARKGFTCHNDSTSILYLKFGSTASATSYTVKLIADAYYELPTTSVYTGIITGIWVSATGSARVTELT